LKVSQGYSQMLSMKSANTVNIVVNIITIIIKVIVHNTSLSLRSLRDVNPLMKPERVMQANTY